MKNIIRKTITALLGAAFIFSSAVLPDIDAKADDETVLVTEYADLWSGNITVKAGGKVKWYVNVPEGTEPKGCSATIKIPELGLGTDSNSKEDEHITLVQGQNFIYEFTPEKEGDILFSCWMGSGCHHNYIHVTADGTYKAEKPADASDVYAKRSGSNVEVSFTAPAVPEGAEITGYKVVATDESGKRKKAVIKKSPAVFEGLDEKQSYIFKVITLATSGDSAGENEFRLSTASEPETTHTEPAEQESAAEYTQIQTETTAATVTTAYTAPSTETGDHGVKAAALQTETSTTSAAAAADNASSPATGDRGVEAAEIVTGIALLICLTLRKSKMKEI